MDTVFARVEFDVKCEWEGLPPTYRVYVNDELFAERTYSWQDYYPREMLQIQAIPGVYRVRVENVGPLKARFHVENHSVEYGPAQWGPKNSIEISHASQ